MSCTDCFQTQKEIEKDVAIVKQQAKALAVKHGCNVYIYQTAQGPAFMVESAAIAQGIQPTMGVVTPMRPVTAQ